jgi:type I restriction enzyme, S subunit
MKKVKLKDVCIIRAGNPAPQGDEYFANGESPFIRVKHISTSSGGYISDSDLVNEKAISRFKLKLFPKDSIVFAKSGMSVFLNVKGRLKDDSYVVSHLAVLIPDTSVINPDYLYYWSKSFKFSSISQSTTLPSIKTKFIEDTELLLPSISEQRKIVSILERAEKLREKRKIASEDTNKIIQSIFYEMFGDPVRNEKRWDVVKWNDCVDILNGRSQKKVIHPDGKYPIYGSGGIMGYADDYITPENSVIIGRKGSINNPIKVKEKFWNVDTAFGLVPKIEKLNSDYLYCFCTLFNFEHINSSTTIPSLTKANLLKIDMALPPIALQNKFAERVLRIESLKETQKQSTDDINILFDALMQKAFRGEI